MLAIGVLVLGVQCWQWPTLKQVAALGADGGPVTLQPQQFQGVVEALRGAHVAIGGLGALLAIVAIGLLRYSALVRREAG